MKPEQWIRGAIAAPVAAFFLAASSTTAAAQVVCGEHSKFVDMLGAKYAEKSVAMGLTSTGAVIEVLTSDAGTWSILITYPTGQTCMVAAGEAWETLPPPEGST